MKAIWKVLAWIFAACGLVAYVSAWGEVWFDWKMWHANSEVLFADSIVTGIFAIFFLAWGKFSVTEQQK